MRGSRWDPDHTAPAASSHTNTAVEAASTYTAAQAAPDEIPLDFTDPLAKGAVEIEGGVDVGEHLPPARQVRIVATWQNKGV